MGMDVMWNTNGMMFDNMVHPVKFRGIRIVTVLFFIFVDKNHRFSNNFYLSRSPT
jgi:hypothetical protein